MKSVHANPPEKICRLCLSDSGVILPIFEGEVAERFSVPLPQKILSCLAIKVHADDPLPPHICHRCLYEVDRFHEFRETCKRTNTTFNKICNNTGESVSFDVNQVLEIKQELHDESVYHDAISDLLSDDEGAELGPFRLRKRNRCLSLLESMKRVQQAQSATAAAAHSEQLSAEWLDQTKGAPASEATANSTAITTPLECRFCAKPFFYESSLLEHEDHHAKGIIPDDSIEQVEPTKSMEQHPAPNPLASPVSVAVPAPVSVPVPVPVPVPVLAPVSAATPSSTPISTTSASDLTPTCNPVPTPTPVPSSTPNPVATSVSIHTSTVAPTPVSVSISEPNSVPVSVSVMEIHNPVAEQDPLRHNQSQESESVTHTSVEAVSLTDVTAMFLEEAFDEVRPIDNQVPTLCCRCLLSCRYCQEHLSNADLLRRHERLYCNRKPSLIKHKQSMQQQSQQQIQPTSHHTNVETSLVPDNQQHHDHITHHLVIQQQGHPDHQVHQPPQQQTEQQIIYSQKVVVETTSSEPSRSCKHCHKDFVHRGSLWRHQMFCDSNPERDLNRIFAGSKKKPSSIKACEGRNDTQQHIMHSGISGPVPVQNVARRGGIQTSSGPFKCKFCEKRFLHRGSWWRHQKMFCAVNPDVPTVKVEAKAQTSQGAPNFACRYCDRTFLHRGSCWHHEQTHTGIKEHACRYCSKTFNEKSRLARHERMHLGIKPFSCRQCGKAFCDASNLRNHEQIHGERASFLCAWCGKSYTRRALLLKHEHVHAGEGQIFSCASCPRTFPDPNTLNEHSLSHTEDRKRMYLCQSCGQAFRSQSLLSQHTQQSHQHIQQGSQTQSQQIQQCASQAHEGQEQTLHTCNICSKAFSDISSLQHHELLHTNGQRQYRCTNVACNAIFHQRSQLDAHLLMHESEKTHSVASTVAVSSSSGFHQHPHSQQQQLLAAHEIQHPQTLQQHEILHREGTYVIKGEDGQTIEVHHIVSQLPQ
ncbi:hypothetical protein ONE63_008358 [Megalurothrips usitatus]|uniref:Uncharacterized protein n=1 Tax=Megalurothrips usitatus TaxID=439358 RepID=A0AAV7XPH3_9NEOP|nr:hypothetical protein ONE63_008358 [Megalurothrips usitatus]